jgi:hypothetical protein
MGERLQTRTLDRTQKADGLAVAKRPLPDGRSTRARASTRPRFAPLLVTANVLLLGCAASETGTKVAGPKSVQPPVRAAHEQIIYFGGPERTPSAASPRSGGFLAARSTV